MSLPPAKLEELLKLYIVSSITGQLAGALKLAPTFAASTGKPPAQIFQLICTSMLPGAITEYCNKSWHSYNQKTDAFVVAKIDSIKGKHPICILSALFTLSLTWLQQLAPHLGELEVGRPHTEIYPMVDAFLAKHYGMVSEPIKSLGIPCGTCNSGVYKPDEVVFSIVVPK